MVSLFLVISFMFHLIYAPIEMFIFSPQWTAILVFALALIFKSVKQKRVFRLLFSILLIIMLVNNVKMLDNLVLQLNNWVERVPDINKVDI